MRSTQPATHRRYDQAVSRNRTNAAAAANTVGSSIKAGRLKINFQTACLFMRTITPLPAANRTYAGCFTGKAHVTRLRRYDQAASRNRTNAAAAANTIESSIKASRLKINLQTACLFHAYDYAAAGG